MVNICKYNSPKVFVQITHLHLFNGTAIWTVHSKINWAAWNHHINGNLGFTSEIATVQRNGICQPHHACNVWLALTVPLWFTCFVMYGWQDATPMEGESLICLEYQVVEITCLIEQAAHDEFWYECPLEEGAIKQWNGMIKKIPVECIFVSIQCTVSVKSSLLESITMPGRHGYITDGWSLSCISQFHYCYFLSFLLLCLWPPVIVDDCLY